MSKAKSWYTGAFPREWDKQVPPPVFPSEKKFPSKSWKKKYKCKKNKGDHTFAILHIHNRFAHGLKGYEQGVMSRVTWACTGCKKHEIERFYDEKYRANNTWLFRNDKTTSRMNAFRDTIYEPSLFV